MTLQFLNKSITDIEGVYASAIHAGIKSDSTLDLAFLSVPHCSASAGVFTQHVFAASSVIHTKKCLKTHIIKAVIVNSGNANTATGDQGIMDTKSLAQLTARCLGLDKQEVGVAATGIIGQLLPRSVFESHARLFSDPLAKNGALFSKGILTTDAFEKTVFLETKIGKKVIEIAGVTKGCGMIAPNMATTLGFLVTSAQLSKQQLAICLKEAIDVSYNMVSVDTDTSTSDMVLLFSTGAVPIAEHDRDQLHMFQTALNEACIHLAKQLVMDGEGAKKLITCCVKGAVRYADAKLVVKQVIDSPLVKTAIAAANPNWGRLVMAIGKNDSIKMNPAKVKVFIGDICVFAQGRGTDFDVDAVTHVLSADAIDITIDLNLGEATATGWGCDLNHTYVDINMEYN